jgi:hypothetical protein
MESGLFVAVRFSNVSAVHKGEDNGQSDVPENAEQLAFHVLARYKPQTTFARLKWFLKGMGNLFRVPSTITNIKLTQAKLRHPQLDKRSPK